MRTFKSIGSIGYQEYPTPYRNWKKCHISTSAAILEHELYTNKTWIQADNKQVLI